MPLKRSNILLAFVAGMLLPLTGCSSQVAELPPVVAAATAKTAPPEQVEPAAPAQQLTVAQIAEVQAARLVVAHQPPAVDPSDAFFRDGVIPQIKIQLSQQEEQKLRADQK